MAEALGWVRRGSRPHLTQLPPLVPLVCQRQLVHQGHQLKPKLRIRLGLHTGHPRAWTGHGNEREYTSLLSIH